MFEKKSFDLKSSDNKTDVFRPSKGSAKVIIGNGVKLKGEITDADEVQIDGNADIAVSTDNLIVGSTGELKGTIQTDNADVWGKADGDLKVSGTASDSFMISNACGGVDGACELTALTVTPAGAVGIGKTSASTILDITYNNSTTGGILITEATNSIGTKIISESLSGSV